LDGSGSIPLTNLVPHVVGSVVCLLLVFLFSGLEAGLLSLNRIRLSERVASGSRRAALLQEILRVPSRLIAVMLTMETTCSVVLAVLWTIMGEKALGLSQGTLVLWGVLLIVILVMFCEIVPKSLFASNAERYTMALAPLVYFLIRVVYPIAAVMEWLAHLFLRVWTGKWVKTRVTTVTEEDLMTMVSVGEDEGVIEEQEREMIHSIFEFGDLVAREIMIPRVDMVALDINTSVNEATKVIVEHGHSRIPVYEGSQDHIKGLLYAKDLLRHVEKGDLEKLTLSQLVRSNVFFVPATKDLSSLLEEMQIRKAHLAIVVDEYGGTAGMVTIEDILEEIVGEIQDEYDKPIERLVSKSPDGTYIVDARLGLHDFDDEIGVVLPEQDGVETVGGLLSQVLGRVPEVGEVISVVPQAEEKNGQWTDSKKKISLVMFKVLEVEDNRIGHVQVCFPGAPESAVPAECAEGNAKPDDWRAEKP
jgi:CBS domain containing-hemolysin-like protein